MPAVLSKNKTLRIPFHELVPGSEGVRYTDINGVPYLSVRDIIMVICHKTCKRASETWINLPESFKSELSEFIGNFQFEGRGQSEQPVITLQGALKLISWLPGNMAKEFRSKACDILTRYLAGDPSLHAEIEANAASAEPINEFARASIPEPSGDKMDSISADVKKLAVIAPVIAQLSNEIVALRADRDNERRMRHQADGRYGSEIREANQNVKRQAQFYRDRVEAAETQVAKHQERCDGKDKQILECHQIIFKLSMELCNLRKRPRSPTPELNMP